MSTDVELYQPGAIMALNHQTDEIVQAITANLAGAEASKFDLTQARVPGPGGKRWKLTHGDGAEEDPETLVGVIVAMEKSRHYYSTPYTSGGDQPDCASYDGGFTGVGNPGGECAVCPMNEWGSAPEGNGKACTETRQILLLPTDSALPVLVSVPPASLKILSGFMLRQGGMGHSYNQFAVELGIGRTKTKTRADVPCVAPKFLGMLSDEEASRARAYAEQLSAIFARNAMNPNGTDPAPANGAPVAETDEQRAERLAAEYGDTIPEN